MKVRRKIFILGVNKTGTTSVESALKVLGYKLTTFNPRLFRSLRKCSNLERLFEEAEYYDACSDIPYFSYFRELDKKFPGSGFILTVRNPEDWYNSFRKFYHRWDLDFLEQAIFRKSFRGEYQFFTDEAAVNLKSEFIRAMLDHNENVRRHFKGRPNDLKVIDLHQGEDPWVALCELTGSQHPGIEFPNRNFRAQTLGQKLYYDFVRKHLVRLKMALMKTGLIPKNWSAYVAVQRFKIWLTRRS
ncbi:MAG: sulfotransferase [Opitutales bacterium]